MGKRYYCDYCDRAFPDSAENRKKHLQGTHHQKLKKIHYNNFRDAATILKEEASKKPCRKFQLGDCQYGPGCKYSHLTDEEKKCLEERVWQDQEKKKQVLTRTDEPSLKDWLKKWKKKQSTGASTSPALYELPKELKNVSNIPPSLIPAQPRDYIRTEVAEWGK